SFLDTLIPDPKNIFSMDMLRHEQDRIAFCRNMKYFLKHRKHRTTRPNERVERFAPIYKLIDGLLYCNTAKEGRKARYRLYIPRTLIPNLLHVMHDLPYAGHLGPEKTIERVGSRAFWPDLRFDVEDYCDHCEI